MHSRFEASRNAIISLLYPKVYPETLLVYSQFLAHQPPKHLRNTAGQSPKARGQNFNRISHQLLRLFHCVTKSNLTIYIEEVHRRELSCSPFHPLGRLSLIYCSLLSRLFTQITSSLLLLTLQQRSKRQISPGQSGRQSSFLPSNGPLVWKTSSGMRR